MLSDSCAICEKDGVFQVEDLPVGIRKFCSEKCFAQYTGLPVQKEGYYGLSKSPTQVPQQQNAENKGKTKINPIEKAEISGMASGATMEGLSALMGAEEEDFEAHSLILPLLLAAEDEGEVILELAPGRNYRVSYMPEEEMLCPLCIEKVKAPYLLACRDYDPAPWEYAEHFFCADCAIHLIYDEDNVACNEDFEAEEPPEKDDPLESWMEDYDAEESAYWFLKGEMQSRAPLTEMDLEQILEMLQNVPAKEMNEAMEQAEMFGDEAAMIVLVMADNKRKFREEYASEYVLLGTMQSTPADGYNGYMKMMRDARKLVEIGNETGLDQKLGEAYQDESGRWFLPILERKASEDEPSVEKLKSYFSRLKSQNPDLARKIEFSVKNEEELPTEEIEKAGFQEDKIEEWVDLVGVEDENLQPYESCPACEGEGIVITNYYPATRYDPADADFEECEDCYGSGEIDPAYYMDKDGNYMAESWQGKSLAGSLEEMDEMLGRKKAESHADRQLEESIKRTKLSAIRTGLAITTFGIVMLNLWINRKQSQQIDNLNKKD